MEKESSSRSARLKYHEWERILVTWTEYNTSGFPKKIIRFSNPERKGEGGVIVYRFQNVQGEMEERHKKFKGGTRVRKLRDTHRSIFAFQRYPNENGINNYNIASVSQNLGKLSSKFKKNIKEGFENLLKV